MKLGWWRKAATEIVLDLFKEKKLRLAFVVAGGGIGITELFKVPGCGQVMGEGKILYDERSYVNFGVLPDRFVSSVASLDMLACLQVGRPKTDICLSVTAALQTNRERKGKDRVFMAIGQLSTGRKCCVGWELRPSSRAKQDEEVTLKAFEQLTEFVKGN